MPSKKIREIVFNKCGGRCAYCGCELESSWQVDHAVSKCYWHVYSAINSIAYSADDISNLMPACKVCNHYKRSLCVDAFGSHTGFRTYMLNFHKRLAKLPKKTVSKQTEKRKVYMTAIANRYGITPEKPFSGVFYFERLKAAS